MSSSRHRARRHGHPSPPHRLERDARREARRAELLDGAVRVIRRHGSAASMEAIASEGGVTKPILYRHFGDRRGLVDAVAVRFAGELMAGLRASLAQDSDDPRRVLVSTIDAYLAFVERDRELYRFLCAGVDAGDAQAAVRLGGFMREVSQQVALVLGERLRSVGADTGGAEPIAYGIVGMVHAAGDWWVESRTMTRLRLVDHLASLLWSGFEGLGFVDPSSAPDDSAQPSAAEVRS